MTINELKETCRNKGISFIPHHECGLCGQPTGWYLFGRRSPYEVAYSSACGCCDGEVCRSTWQEVLDWVCDKDGTLRPEYKYLQPEIDHVKEELRMKIEEILKQARQKKLNPLINQMLLLMTEAFQAGIDAGLDCGKYTNYQQD